MKSLYFASAFWSKLIGCMLLAVSAKTFAADIYAVTSGGIFARFDSATPGTLDELTLITGLGVGESIVGMDFRPATLTLYIMTNELGVGRLYTVNPATAVATLAATLAADPADVTSPYTTLSGTRFSINFNPVPDRLRVVGDSGLNIRVSPTNGLVTTDASLNPGSPNIVGVAYINSYAGAATTTLFDIDSAADTLVIQNPPNNGTLIAVGALGVDTSDVVGFDILSSGNNNIAYSTLSVGGTVGLYSINLGTGAATLVGSVAGNPALIGIAVDQDKIFRNGFD